MRNFLGDISYAVRVLRKEPGFVLTAVLTLGLGLGAAVAIFSVVNAVLLRPLPYREPDRLVHVISDLKARGLADFPWSGPDFADLRDTTQAFSEVAALVTWRQVLVTPGRGDIERISVGAGSPNLFRLLGAGVIVGSDFAESDGTSPAQQTEIPPSPGVQKAILSHEFWTRRFGANPTVVGTVVHLGEQIFEVIGVLQPGFELLYPPRADVEGSPEIWMPLQIAGGIESRADGYVRVIARLSDGATMAEAQAEVDSFAHDLRSRYPLKQSSGLQFRVEPVYEVLVQEVRPSILVLMGAALILLLTACANVANLLLVRCLGREREFAIRSAIGGTRQRLARQLMTENLLLALAAIAFGIVVAWLGLKILPVFGPANLARLDTVSIHPLVFGFSAIAGLVAMVLSGTFPVLRASGTNATALLRTVGGSGLASGGSFRSAVVVAEVALSLVLLVGAGLMVRSFIALRNAQPGYEPHGVLTFTVPDLHLPEAAERRAFMRELHERLRALPGVIDATAANPLPLDGRIGLARWGTEDALIDPARFGQAAAHAVLPGYFGAMRTRIIEGRDYTEAENHRESRMVIIDRILARRAFPGQSAVGKSIIARISTPEAEKYEVIGVVEHQRHTSLATDGREALFVVDGAYGHGVANRWAVRTSGDPMAIVAQARALVSELNPRTGAIEVQPMTAFVEEAQAQTTFALVLIGIFACVALVLAGVGLYSVLSTAVRQRTAEIGVRMAFGAAHGRIFRMMVFQGLKLSAAGIVVGIGAALLLTGTLRTLLVGVEPADPATFAAIVVGFFVIATIACGLPARRASRLNPMVALRDE